MLEENYLWSLILNGKRNLKKRRLKLGLNTSIKTKYNTIINHISLQSCFSQRRVACIKSPSSSRSLFFLCFCVSKKSSKILEHTFKFLEYRPSTLYGYLRAKLIFKLNKFKSKFKFKQEYGKKWKINENYWWKTTQYANRGSNTKRKKTDNPMYLNVIHKRQRIISKEQERFPRWSDDSN